MNLRKSGDLVNHVEHQSLGEGIRLPTNRSVKARFMCFRNERKLKTSKSLIKEIVAEVEEVWGRAFIPTKSTTTVIFLMTSLHEK